MTANDPALTQALDRLAMQVNADNVLAVHRTFRNYADQLHNYLTSLQGEATVGRCGGDPVSAIAADVFNGKIADLLHVHWAHQEELEVAANHLRSIAMSYGITEDAITRSLATGNP